MACGGGQLRFGPRHRLLLPESVLFLTLHERGWGELARVIRSMSPHIDVPADARFVIHEDARVQHFTPDLLFAGSLLFITPLLWLFYIFNSVAVFFMQSWMPVLIQGIGLTAMQAALTTSVSSLGGTIGALVTGQIIDRIGLTAVAVLPLAGAVISVFVGLPMSVGVLEAVVFAQGFFVVGAQFACTAIAPVFYPTAYRANAEGWALAVAKIGSIAGPVIGGALLRMHLPGYQLFYVAAIPLLFSAAFAYGLGRVARGCVTAARLPPNRRGKGAAHAKDRSALGHGDAAVLSDARGDGERARRRRPVWRGPHGARAAGEDRRAARQRGGDLRAERHDGEPDRPEAADAPG
jgi:hypothetical protein